MNELKSSYQPLLAFAVLAVAGQMVQPVQDAILGLFAKKATAVMTNVPGPAAPLTFCGSTLRQTMFWVPASGDIGVGVSILSYGGGVQFGLITDEALCADAAGDHRPLRARVREAAAADDDDAVGRAGRLSRRTRSEFRRRRSRPKSPPA